jgi:NitT/TauT family transport system substrate-binding protein
MLTLPRWPGWPAIGLGVALLAACASPATAPPAAKPPAGGSAPTAAPVAAAPAGSQPSGGASPPGSAAAAPTAPLAPKSLQFAGSYSVSDGGVYVAIDRGYFAEQGLTVDYNLVAAAADTIPALATEQVAAGAIPISAATLNAVARGVELRAVADKGSIRPGFAFEAVLVRKELVDSGRFQTAADLRGLSVATAVPVNGNAAAPALDRLLKQAGLTEADLSEVKALPFPDMNAALAGGAVDMVMQIEPLVHAALTQGVAVRWKGLDEIYPGQQIAVIGYGPLITRRDPDLGRRFLTGYLKGVRDYHRAFTTGQGKAEILEIIGKYSSLSPAVLQDVVPAGLNPDGYVNVESVANDQAFFVERGERPGLLRRARRHPHARAPRAGH